MNDITMEDVLIFFEIKHGATLKDCLWKRRTCHFTTGYMLRGNPNADFVHWILSSTMVWKFVVA